jgi:hypothetical protein
MAPSSSARWRSTRTSSGSAISAAPRASSSLWPNRSADTERGQQPSSWIATSRRGAVLIHDDARPEPHVLRQHAAPAAPVVKNCSGCEAPDPAVKNRLGRIQYQLPASTDPGPGRTQPRIRTTQRSGGWTGIEPRSIRQATAGRSTCSTSASTVPVGRIGCRPATALHRRGRRRLVRRDVRGAAIGALSGRKPAPRPALSSGCRSRCRARPWCCRQDR